MQRPSVLVLDVIETLFSLETVGERLRALGLPSGAGPLFFAQLLRDGFALAAAGPFRPFSVLARGSLEVMLRREGLKASDEQMNSVLEAFGQLDPHGDVATGLKRAQAAGLRVIALTNGSAGNTRRLFERSELDGFLEHIVSIEDVGHWKPHPAVYRHVADYSGESPERLALVAAHAWDTHGAAQVGYNTVWLSRRDPLPNPALDAPGLRAATLHQAVDLLVGLDDS